MYLLIHRDGYKTVILDWDRAVTTYLHSQWIVELQQKASDGTWERISEDA